MKHKDPTLRMFYSWTGIKPKPKAWDTFDKFKAWSLKNGYKEGLMFCRKDCTKEHTLENCEWITPEKFGGRNPRCLPITYNGKTQNLSQWAKEFGLNYVTLFHRLERGWSLEKALTPLASKKNKTSEQSKIDNSQSQMEFELGKIALIDSLRKARKSRKSIQEKEYLSIIEYAARHNIIIKVDKGYNQISLKHTANGICRAAGLTILKKQIKCGLFVNQYPFSICREAFLRRGYNH